MCFIKNVFKTNITIRMEKYEPSVPADYGFSNKYIFTTIIVIIIYIFFTNLEKRKEKIIRLKSVARTVVWFCPAGNLS